MISRLRSPTGSFWAEPRPATVPRNRSDWLLISALIAALLLEAALRGDVGLKSPSFIFCLALMPSVLWRRSHPLLAAGIAFLATGAIEAAGLVTGRDAPDLHAQAFLIILPYALVRWGSGREVLIGVPIILASATLGLASDNLSAGEVLGGVAVLMAPMAIGTATRYREAARGQELDEVRASERLSLARELHDTVAHHVSAIAVQAQAGIVTSVQDPQVATDALRVIGEEASRALSEMRAMVRVLRDDGVAKLSPVPGVADLKGLSGSREGRAHVEVDISCDTAQLPPPLSRAIYRLAREAVTNAHRHARGSTHILVEVTMDASVVSLRVLDDGEPPGKNRGSGGYGLLGMAERAQLLGGTLQAGPGPERGWAVTAVLPIRGADTQS